MSVAFSPISPIAPVDGSKETGATGKVDLGSAFSNALKDAQGAEKTSTEAAEKFAKGDAGVGIHEVVIAAEKANIAVRYATTLKNKALEAYRELMNTQV